MLSGKGHMNSSQEPNDTQVVAKGTRVCTSVSTRFVTFMPNEVSYYYILVFQSTHRIEGIYFEASIHDLVSQSCTFVYISSSY